MGQTLSEPVVLKATEEEIGKDIGYGLSSMQGWRITMEDSHTAVLDLQARSDEVEDKERGQIPNGLSFFGVFDGHGGSEVAEYSGSNMVRLISESLSSGERNYGILLSSVFLQTDQNILKDLRDVFSGCTATVALVSDTEIYCANAGDSRTVVSVGGVAKPLSFDHKPSNEGEKSRILAAGGFVDYGRVNGNLALSRAIGDFEFKRQSDLPPEQQIVTAMPDIIVHELGAKDEFLVLACDGIWDCLSSQEIVDIVRKKLAEGQSLGMICEGIMDQCLAESGDTGGVGCDNMTIIITALLRGKSFDAWRLSLK